LNHHCYYADVSRRVSPFILAIKYDLIIFHYTLISIKDLGFKVFKEYLERCEKLINSQAYKIAIPQDEYTRSDYICYMTKKFGIKTIFTCLPKTEWQKVYPYHKSKVKDFIQVFPGYIDEKILKNIQYVPHCKRPIDIGYRARKVPYWLGYHGLQKWQITNVFKENLIKTLLNYDLSNNIKLVFYGKEWSKFLSSCRCVLGCEGGSSLLDPRGLVRKKIDAYMEKHSRASFQKVKKLFFNKQDGGLRLFALSPRHFDASITRTCQVLMEGEYGGIFIPNKHYIEVKKDFRNISDVVKKITDVTYCENIAQNTYKDIVLSNKYTYRVFVSKIIDHLKDKILIKKTTIFQKIIITIYFSSVILWHVSRIMVAVLLILGKIFFLNRIYKVIKKIFKKFLQIIQLFNHEMLNFFFRLKRYYKIT